MELRQPSPKISHWGDWRGNTVINGNLEVNSNPEKKVTDNEKDTHIKKNLNNLLIEQIFYQKYTEKIMKYL